MVTGNIVGEAVCEVTVDKLWNSAVVDVYTVAQVAIPDKVKSIDILEGDGGAGTIRKFNFANAVGGVTHLKEKVTQLSKEQYLVNHTVLEGGIASHKLKSENYEVRLEATANGGTKVTVKVEYETVATADLSNGEKEDIMGGILGLFRGIAAHIK